MVLPSGKVSELKQLIRNQMNRSDIQSEIREILEDRLRATDGDVTEADLLAELHRKGVVDNLVSQLSLSAGQPVNQSSLDPKQSPGFINRDEVFSGKKGAIDSNRRYLFLQVLSGRAFVEHLSESNRDRSSTFTVHIDFRGQRFRSRGVPCACEPEFSESFLLDASRDRHTGDIMLDATGLLSLFDPLHLVVVRTEASGDAALVASHYLEWRDLLCAPSGRVSRTLELMGIGVEAKVPVGLIDVTIEMVPRLGKVLAADVVTAQLEMERSRRSERERSFLMYAKQWWKEYLEVRPSHASRLVKLFACDETATNRMVCAYVAGATRGVLDSPSQSARFISLIGYEAAAAGLGGGASEVWASCHAFLAANKGDVENHVTLLCSLLIGFGLKAYVAVGTKAKGQTHSWVVTLGPAAEGRVCFWESLTGSRYLHNYRSTDVDGPLDGAVYPYRTIGCLFNHSEFYANCQPSDSVELTSFDLTDAAKWKAMSESAIASVCGAGLHWRNRPSLCPPLLDGVASAVTMETELRRLVSDYRGDERLTTRWDEDLSFVMTQALAAYESERSTGVTTGNQDFQDAVRNVVPDGHTFKGFPLQLLHRNARRAFATAMKSPVAKEIVSCRGDSVRLAVRVRIFSYAESAIAVWVMFACKYKSVQ